MNHDAAAAAYRAKVEAVQAQQARLAAPFGLATWDRVAAMFRQDPLRKLDRNLSALAELVEPGDVVLDVGGGSGRIGLPLALHAREIVNVEPSPGMCAQFVECAKEAGITNARAVQADWMDATGVSGDVVLVANVTYFVADIVPFVEKLAAAARRRVVISVWSVPPPNQAAKLFEAAFGEPQVLVPGHEDLLPLLWAMDILADVRVLPEPFGFLGQLPTTREEALTFALQQVRAQDQAAASARLAPRLDDLFAHDGTKFVPTWRPPAREILITWQT